MTPKQKLFIQEYIVDLNATQAALRSGYSERTAFRIGAENMQKPVIREAIEFAIKERSERTQLKADAVLKELSHIIFFNVKRIFTADGHLKSLSEMDEADTAAISSMEVAERMTGDTTIRVTRIKFHDKNKAIDSAMRHLGMYNNDKLSIGVMSHEDALAELE
ncbi:MAG: terminase small subunit [Desulfobacteraceae bacterium]|jgi:phage terminase small subunit